MSLLKCVLLAYVGAFMLLSPPSSLAAEALEGVGMGASSSSLNGRSPLAFSLGQENSSITSLPPRADLYLLQANRQVERSSLGDQTTRNITIFEATEGTVRAALCPFIICLSEHFIILLKSYPSPALPDTRVGK